MNKGIGAIVDITAAPGPTLPGLLMVAGVVTDEYCPGRHRVVAGDGEEELKMRLTTAQRIAELERETVVLRDTVKVLHNMLKQQKQLINEYITAKFTAHGKSAHGSGSVPDTRPEDALYTFRCRRRFEKIERDIRKMRESPSHPSRTKRVG